MGQIPDKPTLDGIESRWAERWEADGIYRFDRTAERPDVFSVDTPPPTVSGSIHMGTVFGYTQTDAIARQRRMAGKAVFFPIGWDDNGLATERRVQNYYGVRCDPSLPYVPGFTPPYEGGEVTHALDASMFATLDGVVREATKALDAYDHARALEIAESFFWTFCGSNAASVPRRLDAAQ